MSSSSDTQTLDVTATLGAWSIAFFVASILYGVALLQTWLYFHWYADDSWRLKSAVVAITVFETCQIALMYRGLYFYLIQSVGNTAQLSLLIPEDAAQLLFAYLSAFTVQVYFGHCVYILNKRNLWAPIIILTLALVQIGSGIAHVILTTRISTLEEIKTIYIPFVIECTAAASCDIAITVSLCVTFHRIKGNVSSTNSMLQKLTIFAVNRGLLTSVAAVVSLATFLARPNSFWWFFGLLWSGKLYMNTMLATLNTREYVKDTASVTATNWRVATAELPSNITRGAIDITGAHVTTIELREESNETSRTDLKRVTPA